LREPLAIGKSDGLAEVWNDEPPVEDESDGLGEKGWVCPCMHSLAHLRGETTALPGHRILHACEFD